MKTTNTKHRQVRITLSTTKDNTTKTITGRIVTVLRANRKYSTKYLDRLGIVNYISNSSEKCRIVLKTLDGKISVIDVNPKIVYNSKIIRYAH